jgi:hypothetical protein
MAIEGTVVNGAIVRDGGAELPDGARVRIELAQWRSLGGNEGRKGGAGMAIFKGP